MSESNIKHAKLTAARYAMHRVRAAQYAVLALNGMAGAMWFVNRGIERPEAGGSLWAILRSLGSGGVG